MGKASDTAGAAAPAANAMPATEAVDPVCGMTVQVAEARYTSTYQGKTFVFCGIGCKESFDCDPERYTAGSHV